MNEKDRSFVLRLAATVLAVAILAMLSTLLIGLFNVSVDNAKIFAILGPSYQTIVGCFVGLLAGLAASNKGDKT